MARLVTVEVLVVRQRSGRAFQVILRDYLPFFWIPYSQVDCEPQPGDRDFYLEIPEWLARKNGLIP